MPPRPPFRYELQHLKTTDPATAQPIPARWSVIAGSPAHPSPTIRTTQVCALLELAAALAARAYTAPGVAGFRLLEYHHAETPDSPDHEVGETAAVIWWAGHANPEGA